MTGQEIVAAAFAEFERWLKEQRLAGKEYESILDAIEEYGDVPPAVRVEAVR